MAEGGLAGTSGSDTQREGGGGAPLRDFLAADRTVMANERTLLSYVRTSLAFGGAGAAIVHFFPSPSVQALGWTAVGLTALIALLGGGRYLMFARRVRGYGLARPQGRIPR